MARVDDEWCQLARRPDKQEREASLKTGEKHRVPLTDEMLAIIEPLQALKSEYVFEGQRRHKPLSNMAMLMLLRRIDC